MPSNFRTLGDRIKSVLLFSDYEQMEVFCAAALLILAVVVINPYTNVFSNSYSYNLIRTLFSEEILGAILLFSAIGSLLYALLIEGIQCRLGFAVLQSLIWLGLFILFIAQNGSVLWPWLSILFFVSEAIISARIYRDLKTLRI